MEYETSKQSIKQMCNQSNANNTISYLNASVNRLLYDLLYTDAADKISVYHKLYSLFLTYLNIHFLQQTVMLYLHVIWNIRLEIKWRMNVQMQRKKYLKSYFSNASLKKFLRKTMFIFFVMESLFLTCWFWWWLFFPSTVACTEKKFMAI
jgi:hypothetical protein